MSDTERKSYDTFTAKVGDLVMVEQDGRVAPFRVDSVAPAGSAGTSRADGPRVTARIVGGRGYRVAFDKSTSHIKAWAPTADDMGAAITKLYDEFDKLVADIENRGTK